RRPDRHVGERARCGDDPFAVDREGDLAFEDVEAFLLPAVDVRWRTAARWNERFPQGVLSVRVVARDEEAVHVPDDGDGAAFGGLAQRWLAVHLLIPHSILVDFRFSLNRMRLPNGSMTSTHLAS